MAREETESAFSIRADVCRYCEIGEEVVLAADKRR